MARRSEEKKPTNVAIKKERKKISDSISIDKQNRASLLKEIKDYEPTVKGQRKILAATNAEIQDSLRVLGQMKVKIDQLDKEISDKTHQADIITGRLKKVEAVSNGMIEDAKKEIERIKQENAGEIDKLTSEVNALTEKIRILTSNKEELEKGLSALEITISNARNNLAVLEKQIQEKKEELEKLNLEGIETAKKTLSDLGQNITDLKGRKNEMEQNLAEIEVNIREEGKKLEAIRATAKATSDGLNKKEEALKATSDGLNKKEEALKATSDGLNKKEEDLAAKEKKILTLGNTLQKHLDKQNIPIKVFE